MPLTCQTALITGAGSGIGRAIAISLAQAGVRVALIGRRYDKLEETRAELRTAADQAVLAQSDVTDRPQLQAAIEAVLGQMGRIDLLVCAAGINVGPRSLRSLAPEDWDRVLNTNLTGAFNTIHYVLPSMRASGNGLIVQISSISGLRASTISGVAYSASKFGQSALGICLGREERGRGIRSTVLYPGEVNTSFLDIRSNRPGGGEAQRRPGILQPEDIAATVRFLAELPPHVHIPELVIKPTIDDYS